MTENLKIFSDALDDLAELPHFGDLDRTELGKALVLLLARGDATAYVPRTDGALIYKPDELDALTWAKLCQRFNDEDLTWLANTLMDQSWLVGLPNCPDVPIRVSLPGQLPPDAVEKVVAEVKAGPLDEQPEQSEDGND